MGFATIRVLNLLNFDLETTRPKGYLLFIFTKILKVLGRNFENHQIKTNGENLSNVHFHSNLI